MDLVTDPGVFNVIFFLKLIDNTLADIAEWSDVVEKNFHPDHAFPRLSFIFFYALKGCNFLAGLSPEKPKGETSLTALPEIGAVFNL
jgi:hypothetical protein